MADDWAAFREGSQAPTAGAGAPSGDPWAAFRDQPAPAPAPVAESPQASPAFVNRLAQGQAMSQAYADLAAKPYSEYLKEWSAGQFKSGTNMGRDLAVVGGIAATIAQIPEMMVSGVKTARYTLDGKILTGPGLRKEDFSDDPNAPEPLGPLIQRSMDMAMTGGVGSSSAPLVSLESRMPLLRTPEGQFVRPSVDPDGSVRGTVVGGMPERADFKNAAESIKSQHVEPQAPGSTDEQGTPKAPGLAAIPSGLSLKVSEKENGGREYSLVDAKGQTHYRADVNFPEKGDGNPPDLAGVQWIENTSRKFSGLGAAFYQKIAENLNAEGKRLVVGASASESAAKVHSELEKAGYAKEIDANTIRPGLANEASAAGERLMEVSGKPEALPHDTLESLLHQLWEKDGIHPSEVAHDAANDPFLKHDLANNPQTYTLDETFEGAMHSLGAAATDMRPPAVRLAADMQEHRQALLKSPSELAQYARDKGLSDSDVKFLIDDNYSAPWVRKKQYEKYLEAKSALPEPPMRSLGAAAMDDLPPLTSPQQFPLRPPGGISGMYRAALDKGFDFARDLQMHVSPMAVGSEIIPKAVAKDFANAKRYNAWDSERWMADNNRRFNADSLKRQWQALDEESMLRQEGKTSEHMGLNTLSAEERANVENVIAHNEADWKAAQDAGLVDRDSIPAYAARIAINTGGEQGALPINSIGLNLKTSTARFRKRQFETVEETEAALKKIHPEAEIARNINANILAMQQVRDAIAGRQLVDKIKEYGQKAGDETIAEGFKPSSDWFTIDHPALKTWRPKLQEVERTTDTGEKVKGWEAAKDDAGNTIFEQVPLYIKKDWEGPLRSVLSQKPSLVAQGLLEAKGRAMSLIMYSPFIHNSVIFSKALAGYNGNVIKTVKLYFDGNRVKNDPAQMREAIVDGGMVPIGKRFFNQDITDTLTAPSLTPGDSLTAKMAAFVPGLFDEAAGTAVKKAIDKAGNFYHNTLLWDRVADLQAGIFADFRDKFMSSGIDRQTAVRMAGHEANRLAGSLPVESMSAGARTVANTLLFSRTFTLGNIGIMKDMFTGLPKDVLAQIERDAGPQAAQTAAGMAKRKAIATVVTDMALFYVGTSIMQNAANVILNGSNVPDEVMGYWTRLQKELAAKASNPWAAIPPWGIYSFLQNISATGGNEPGKQDRVYLGHSPDGTGIYAKSPMGRIGEEFSDYSQGFWLDLLHRKLGTIARPAWEIMSNDRGFGRKVYDPHIDSATGALNASWAMAKELVKAQAPVTQIEAFGRLVKGEGDQTLNTLQTVGPFMPPPFTFTASKGAPGGPAVGQYFDIKAQQEFRVQQAMPGIRQMIQRGDLAEAREQMEALHMSKSYQQSIFRTTLNPASRLSTRSAKEILRTAPPEQIERFNNLRAQ